MHSLLELQCLIGALVPFLELSIFIHVLPLIYYLMKWGGNSDMKKNILLDTIYISFFKRLLQMT